MLRLLIAGWLILMGLAAPAAAEKPRRIAIVVGVSEYDDETLKLDHPENDARRIAEALKTIHGFEVIPLMSRDKRTLRHLLMEEWQYRVGELKDHDVVLLYFAGHGIELKGRNYLLPSDVRRSAPSAGSVGAITLTSIDFQWMLELLADRQNQHGGVTGIFILDACRNNPFPFAEDLKDDVPVGLVAGRLPSTEVFIMYSAGVGQEALDGLAGAGHSVFAEALLAEIGKREGAGVPLTEIARRVRLGVYRTTLEHYVGHTQVPAYYDQLRSSRTLSGEHAEPVLHGPGEGNERIVFSREPRPPDIIIECPFCPELVVVDSGLAIGKFEVTNREWDRCVREGVCPGPERSSPGTPHLEHLPVTGVSWHHAKVFVTWLNKATGHEERPLYRLPTESEWENAARTRDGPGFVPDDPRAICDHANGADADVGLIVHSYRHCSDGAGRRPAHVGRYKPNASGLHDMIGNVWEWVEDCDRDRGACIARGGSWRSGYDALKRGARNAFAPDHSRATLGFRVVRALTR